MITHGVDGSNLGASGFSSNATIHAISAPARAPLEEVDVSSSARPQKSTAYGLLFYHTNMRFAWAGGGTLGREVGGTLTSKVLKGYA